MPNLLRVWPKLQHKDKLNYKNNDNDLATDAACLAAWLPRALKREGSVDIVPFLSIDDANKILTYMEHEFNERFRGGCPPATHHVECLKWVERVRKVINS